MSAQTGDRRKQGVRLLSPGAIQIAPELAAVQRLMPISADDRAKLRASIEADGLRDPLRGYAVGRDVFILSGFNRLAIARELSLSLVPVEVLDIDESEREAFAIDENLSRRHLSAEQKRGLVAYLLKLAPADSDLAIARRAGVSDKTVASVRESRSEFPNVGKVDSRGRKVGQKPKASPSAVVANLQKPTSRIEAQRQIAALQAEAKAKRKQAAALLKEAKELEAQVKRLAARAKKR